MRLEALGFVDLVELHGKSQFSETGAMGRDLIAFESVWSIKEMPACDTPQQLNESIRLLTEGVVDSSPT